MSDAGLNGVPQAPGPVAEVVGSSKPVVGKVKPSSSHGTAPESHRRDDSPRVRVNRQVRSRADCALFPVHAPTAPTARKKAESGSSCRHQPATQGRSVAGHLSESSGGLRQYAVL